MNASKANLKSKAGIAATIALVAACIPCCISLAAPILAWLGLATLGGMATGWYLFAAAAFAVGAAALFFLRRRRPTVSCNTSQEAGSCDCSVSCKS